MSDDRSADGQFGSGGTWDPVGGRPVNPDLAASATQDDRPSISELQRMGETSSGEGCENIGELLQSMAGFCSTLAVATPLLLEIAAAALAMHAARQEYLRDQSVSCRKVGEAHAVLDAALSKVRP